MKQLKATFAEFCSSYRSEISSVLSPEFQDSPWALLDFSASGPALPTGDLREIDTLEKAIRERIVASGAKVGYGGYGEKRAWYQNSPHFGSEDGPSKRNIHLGVDIWVPAGTSLFCPYPGKVHSIQYNGAFLDYGHTIILEHTAEVKGESFHWYSLYGHLARKGWETLKVGQRIGGGEPFCFVGAPEENGQWIPHLHLQLMHDLEGNVGDYPGVSSEQNWPHYEQNCPDPALLLNPKLIPEAGLRPLS